MKGSVTNTGLEIMWIYLDRCRGLVDISKHRSFEHRNTEGKTIFGTEMRQIFLWWC